MGRHSLIGLTTEEKRQRHLQQMREYNKKHKEKHKIYHKNRYDNNTIISCNLCNFTAKSKQNFQVHLTRKKHIKNIEIYQKCIYIVLILIYKVVLLHRKT